MKERHGKNDKMEGEHTVCRRLIHPKKQICTQSRPAPLINRYIDVRYIYIYI